MSKTTWGLIGLACGALVRWALILALALWAVVEVAGAYRMVTGYWKRPW